MPTSLQAVPVVYLDFDGVLHPDEVYLQRGQGVVLRSQWGHLFMFAEKLEAALAPYPAVRIVLSTSWVPTLGFDQSKARLPAGLQARIIGATYHSSMDAPTPWGGPSIDWRGMARHQQILRHVRRHGVQDWIAIDDDVDDWPVSTRHRVIACDSDLGLGEIAAHAALLAALQEIGK